MSANGIRRWVGAHRRASFAGAVVLVLFLLALRLFGGS